MINLVKHIPLKYTRCCTELSDRRILVTGYEFIKVFSLDTYEEIKDIPPDRYNRNSLVVPDRNVIFITTEKGLHQYSLPEFNLVKVHEPTSDVYFLAYLKSKNRVLSNNFSNLLSLNLDDSTVTTFEDLHTSYITSIVSTSDEKYFFTTGGDNTLNKWSTDSWSVVKSICIGSIGRSLLVNEESGTVLVGGADGSLAEYSLNDLNLIRKEKVHTDWINRILKLSSGDVITCSDDGSVRLLFKDNVLMKVYNTLMYSIIELSDKTIACCCGDGLRIIASPVTYPSLVEESDLNSSILDLIPSTLDSNSSILDPIPSTLDSISSSIHSIKTSTFDKKTQLISLLQHHLTQLLSPIQHQPEKFTGLALSLLPDLKSIQRNHLHDGSSEGHRKILTQNYSLEMMSSNSSATDAVATLTLFERKMKFFGRIANVENPTVDFKVLQMRKRKWVFTMDQEFVLDDCLMKRPATAHFSNGHLNCLVSEGDPLTRHGYQSTLKINTAVKEVISLGHDGVVVTSDQTVYRLNFDTNRITNPTHR